MILDEILEYKRQELKARKPNRSMGDMERNIAQALPSRGFTRALRQSAQGTLRASGVGTPVTPKLIAEIKERSPSRGAIRLGADAVAIARAYKAGGAACISVLTDSRFFGGAMERLGEVRQVVDSPLLQKDFVIDPFQILEARLAGADCILLIVAALAKAELLELHACALEAGLDALVEAHSREELCFAIESGFELIGINNRSLQTFEVDLETTVKLAPLVPDDRVLVGESGVFSRQDVERLAQAGVDAILVGEALMSTDCIEEKVRELVDQG